MGTKKNERMALTYAKNRFDDAEIIYRRKHPILICSKNGKVRKFPMSASPKSSGWFDSFKRQVDHLCKEMESEPDRRAGTPC